MLHLVYKYALLSVIIIFCICLVKFQGKLHVSRSFVSIFAKH